LALDQKKREMDEEIEEHQHKYPCLSSHHENIDGMVQDLTMKCTDIGSICQGQIHQTNMDTANLSRSSCQTSVTAEAVKTSSVTTGTMD